MRRLLTSGLVLLLLLAVCGVDAWNFGESLPVTVHMRLQRETPHAAVARDDADDADDIIDAAAAAGEGQQYTRQLPPDSCPRFGINKRVHHPAKLLFSYARNASAGPVQSLSSVALRFQLERGLKKGTAWLPLLKGTRRRSPTAHENQLPRDDDTLYLSTVVFKFGFQGGTFNRITSFHAHTIYSAKLHDEIELQYHWDEHRAYNPHRALSVCAVTSVLTAVVVLHIILFRGGKLTHHFRAKKIALRNHKE
ncbi:hypothetical protein DQ04_08791010 [Trypanosoma grayi]|uniref:hypothetical protein n=1 Tax=Trypanosoma grayi TaxID=71804 RepID=UPI0004F463BB|nr:hypothetical protein DQ04_08791010 [Trypanosoma grayi]KEG07799.1 hypothetical protein DQ04_08791010 [Trypanosoma grayi]